MCLVAHLSSSTTNWSKVCFRTCRSPVCVWTRFMHCWFNGFLPESLWQLLPENWTPKRDQHLKDSSTHSSPNSKAANMDLTRKWTARKPPGGRSYMQWCDSQGRAQSIVRPLGPAERQHYVMCLTNDGSNNSHLSMANILPWRHAHKTRCWLVSLKPSVAN